MQGFQSLGGRWDSNPRQKNHHIPHIINKLQQQPKSTFQKGYKYVHNFLLFEQRYTKICKQQNTKQLTRHAREGVNIPMKVSEKVRT